MALPSFEGEFLPLEIPEADFANAELTQTASLTPTDTFHEIETKPDLGAAEAVPSTDPDIVAKRAEKAHLALGEKSPGLPVLRNQMDMGEEMALREAVAASEAIADRKFRLGMVQEATRSINRPLTPDEADELMSLVRTDTSKDPSTILEELYGQRVVSGVPAMLKNASVHQEALNKIPEQYLDTADASAQHIAKNQIARAVLEDVEAEWQRQGIFSTVTSYAKQLVPFWSYANLTSAVENAPTSFSLKFGRTIAEEVDYLYALKPSDFKKELTAAVRTIAEDSPLDALLFAQGVISYSTNDEAIDNVFGALDMSVFLMPLKGLRGAKAVADAVPDVPVIDRQVERVLKTVDAAPKTNIEAGTTAVAQTPLTPIVTTKGVSVVWDQGQSALVLDSRGSLSSPGSKSVALTATERYPDVNPRNLVGMPKEYVNDPVKASEYVRGMEVASSPETYGDFQDYLLRDIAKETGLTKSDIAKVLAESRVIDTIQERIRNGLAKKIPAKELVQRHIHALSGIVDEVSDAVGNLPAGENVEEAIRKTLTIRTLVDSYNKTKAGTKFSYQPDITLYENFFLASKDVRFSDATESSLAFRGEKGFSVPIDLGKIGDVVKKPIHPGKRPSFYAASEEGLNAFIKDSGYEKSLFSGPIHSVADVQAATGKLVKDIPESPELEAAVQTFLDDSFAPWPKFTYDPGKMRVLMDMNRNKHFVQADPRVMDYKVGPTIRSNAPLYVDAESLPSWLGRDRNLLIEHALWHETAHTVVEAIAQRMKLSIPQKENLVNAMALIKIRQRRTEPGVRGSRKVAFGNTPEPIPYQMKDFSKATGGVRDPAVVYTGGPAKGSFITIDKPTGALSVNRDALTKQYERKPWKNFKTKGVKPLDDTDFQTAQDWIDFSVEKAKLKSVLTRVKGEASSVYENRLNQLALQSLRNTKLQKGAVTLNMMRDTTRAGMAADIPEGIGKVGMTDEAADLTVKSRLQEEWSGLDPLDDSASLRSRVPSIFSVESLGGVGVNERANRILKSLSANAERLLGIPLNNAAIVRLPEQALQVAIDETKKALAKTYDRVNDAFLDASFEGPYAVTRPEEQLVNTTVVHLRLGKPDATLFDTPSQAAIYGVDMYGLSPQGFSILQQGQGFYINISKTVDETLDAVRNVLIDTNNKSEGGFLNAFLNLIRTPEDQLSKLQNANRKLATTAAQELHRIMLDSSKAISKNLTTQERNQLSRMWRENRDYIDEATGERGFYHETISGFEDAFLDRFKQMPSEAQTEAYFTYVQLNDMDYILRNLALHRDLSRIGAEQVRVFTDVMTDAGVTVASPGRPFAGRFADNIPFEDGSEDFGIWVYDPRTKKGEFHLRSQVTKDIRDDIEGKLSGEGFRVIEVVNPLEKPLLDIAHTQETIHFAVVKNFDNKKFDWGILPRRPGGHVEYGDQFFVKQPKIRRSTASGSLRNIYEGDVSLLSAATGAEARKWAKVADQGRRLLRAGKEKELEEFLDKNAPWNLEEFKKFFTEQEMPDGTFKPALLHMDDEITWTYTGRNTSDMDHFKQTLGGYENFYNGIRSKYNLFAQSVDKKYLGSRDPDLPRVLEEGTEGNPIFRLAKPRLLSPLETLNKSIANVTRSRHMTDYKTSVIESFIEEFADVMKTDRAELRRNPVYYFHNPVWDTETTNKALLSAAQATRRANLMFIGTESELGSKMFWLQSKLVDSIYSKLGQKASNFVTEKYLPTVKDPFTYARSIAFHTKLGLFNPVQLALQAQSWVHVAAIAGPDMALKAAGDAIRMRQLRLTEDENIIAHYARMSGRADLFKESYKELKKTGYYNVGGEVAWRDDVFEPQLFKGPIGTFLEKGTFFFDEGERFVRLSAWNAAFYAWREANPGKTIDNLTRNQILQRADLMSVNMTRASNAAWQNGLWSVPTQFLAFQARLAEQLLPGFSSRLTKAEKIRAYLTYSAVYGLPVGAGATFGVYPFYEDIRQSALERGINLDNKLLQVAHEGMLSTLTSVISGKDYNVNERFGPGGTTLFKEVVKGEKPVMELLLGASGSILGDMIASAEPATNALLSLFNKDVAPPTMEDFIEVTRNISTINNAAKAWYMYNQGRYFTKNGNVVTDSHTGFDAFMTGILGLTPRDATDTFLMLKSRKEQRQAEQEAEQEVIKWYRKAIREYNNDDADLGDAYLRRAKAWLISSGISPDKYSSIMSKAVKENETLFNSVREDFWRKAPAGQQLDRQKAMQK